MGVGVGWGVGWGVGGGVGRRWDRTGDGEQGGGGEETSPNVQRTATRWCRGTWQWGNERVESSSGKITELSAGGEEAGEVGKRPAGRAEDLVDGS